MQAYTIIAYCIARSPIYSHLSLTMQGLPTIRSYSMQGKSMTQFYTYQNKNTQASYLFVVANRYINNTSYIMCTKLFRWLGLRIESLCCIFISVLAFASVPLSLSK